MKHLLPGLIHHNQSGYIPGRNISENIRSILDIMEFTKVKKLPGLLLFLDFEKAFGSLEWDFLEKCLEKFNFGPDFRRWVHSFYKRRSKLRNKQRLMLSLLPYKPWSKAGGSPLSLPSYHRSGNPSGCYTKSRKY